MSVDKAALFAPRLPERDVEIPGVGSVRVRGLSRAESVTITKVNADEREAHIVAMALIEPRMSVSEVKQWMAAAPAGELEPVSQAVGELSGLLEASPRETFPDVREQPGS